MSPYKKKTIIFYKFIVTKKDNKTNNTQKTCVSYSERQNKIILNELFKRRKYPFPRTQNNPRKISVHSSITILLGMEVHDI